MIDIGKSLREARELAGLTQGAAADKAQLSQSLVSRIETGEVENPGVQTLRALEDALGLTNGSLSSGVLAFRGKRPRRRTA